MVLPTLVENAIKHDCRRCAKADASTFMHGAKAMICWSKYAITAPVFGQHWRRRGVGEHAFTTKCAVWGARQNDAHRRRSTRCHRIDPLAG